MTQWAYSHTERYSLWCVALLELLGVNGAFFYGLFHPEMIRSALQNPISIAFMTEALVLMGVLAYLLTKWGVMRLRWTWFVLLSLVGSLTFAVPFAVLYRRRQAN